MSGRRIAIAAVLGPVLLVGSATAAVPHYVSINAPAKAKVGKAFRVTATVRFDARLYQPPRRWPTAVLFTRRGEDSCPKGLPFEKPGWTQLATDTFDPGDENYSTEFYAADVKLRKPGTQLYCAYIYVTDFSTTTGSYSYQVKKRDRHVVRVVR